MAGIESEIKRLQGQVDVESAILKDRQRIIDLYESQGYISFKEATEARLAAQEDFTERLRALTVEEEAILRRGLESVAKTTQDKLKLQDRLAEILLKRQRLEREAQQSNLERQIRLPGETMKDLAEQAARGQSELRAIEEQIKTLRETGAISELDSLRRLAAARRDSANQLATLAAQARELVEAAPGNEKLADALKKIEESARQAADGATLLNQRVKELADPEAGFAKGLRMVAEEAEQIGKQLESATVRALNGMTVALVNFVMTGLLDFRSLANSIISDLIRIQIRAAMVGGDGKGGLLGSLFSAGMSLFGGGSSVNSSQYSLTTASNYSSGGTGLKLNALGGIYDSPSLSQYSNQIHDTPKFFAFAKGAAGVFGEAGPEAIMPLTRAANGSLGVRAVGGAASNIKVEIINSGQPMQVERTEVSQDADGQLVLKAFLAEAVKQSVQAVAAQTAGDYGDMGRAMRARKAMGA